jgi:lysophospholipase L1-like esterase
VTHEPNEDDAWYEPEIRAFEAADRAHPPEPGRVLFVGSSSIRMWTTLGRDMHPVPIVSRGFGGSKTFEVLEVFDRIVTPHAPRAIVYYCGDNDLGTDNTDADAAAQGFIAFDRRARALWPGVQVLYIAIKPSLARWSNWNAMQRANAIVADYCSKTRGTAFLDIATPMLAPDGRPRPELFEADGLHLNAEGYAVWTGVVGPAVRSAWQDGQRHD